MKITTKQACASLAALQYLGAQTLDQGLGITFGLALKQVADINETFDKERFKLVKKFGAKDDDGNTKKDANGMAIFTDAAQEQFQDAVSDLQGAEVTITSEVVKRSQLAKEKLPGFIYGALDWLIVADDQVKPADAG